MKQKIASYLILLVKCAIMVPAVVLQHVCSLMKSVYVLIVAALLGDVETYNRALGDTLDRFD